MGASSYPTLDAQPGCAQRPIPDRGRHRRSCAGPFVHPPSWGDTFYGSGSPPTVVMEQECGDKDDGLPALA